MAPSGDGSRFQAGVGRIRAPLLLRFRPSLRPNRCIVVGKDQVFEIGRCKRFFPEDEQI